MRQIVGFWDDNDGGVRRMAIDLVQVLAQSSPVLPEVRELLEAPGAKQSSRLMTEITKRVKDPGYGDKDALNKLLNWYFANLRR